VARNPDWTRDERILPLDLYRRLGQAGPSHPGVLDLSAFIRKLPFAVAGDPATFRNPDSVRNETRQLRQYRPRPSWRPARASSRR
jgi:hypothetical protein